jgi:hypothetical protein
MGRDVGEGHHRNMPTLSIIPKWMYKFPHSVPIAPRADSSSLMVFHKIDPKGAMLLLPVLLNTLWVRRSGETAQCSAKERAWIQPPWVQFQLCLVHSCVILAVSAKEQEWHPAPHRVALEVIRITCIKHLAQYSFLRPPLHDRETANISQVRFR